MSASNDGSESVDQFLARIASIKEPRDQANEERTKRIEEDFVKNRKERQARRLERARSLSPSKTVPARSNSTITSPAPSHQTAINPPVDFSPRSSTLTRSNAIRTSPTLEPQQPILDAPSLSQPSPDLIFTTPTSLARSGTLSWQQRRTGREDSLPRPRPLSTIENVRNVVREDSSPTSSPKERSRQEIAASLASKDPLWFRQTQERGTGSAAFRKTQVEDTPPPDPTLRTMRLPGLSQDDSGIIKSTVLPANQDLVREKLLPAKPMELTQSLTPNKTLLPDAAKEETLAVDSAQAANSGIDISSGLRDQPSIIPSAMARSPSPTKGLGGFVQSAMMKRSDSVNKRWSVQANSGLKRGDSVASNRPSPGVAAVHKPTTARDAASSPMVTPKLDQKPSSIDPPVKPVVKSSLTPQETIGKSAQSSDTTANQESETKALDSDELQEDLLSRSPSKTLDPRRWSPTKSSWLESTLLSQPEPMKVAPKKEEQPQWMVNLQRTRSKKDTPQKESPETVQNRSVVPASPTKFAQNLSSEVDSVSKVSATKTSREAEASTFRNFNTNKSLMSRDTQDKPSLSAASNVVTSKSNQNQTANSNDTTSNSVIGNEAAAESASAQEARKLPPQKPHVKPQSLLQSPSNLDDRKPMSKPKPQTPPKIDFRATLRSRAPPAADGKDSEPEFKAIFGKLKSAQTKNYVAPDELKNNILTGKAALNFTDGPQKTKRVDEFKESILQKKEAMKASAEQSKHDGPSKPSTPKPEAPLPEALARRKTLHRATPSTTKEDLSTDSKGDDRPKLSKSSSSLTVQQIPTTKGEGTILIPDSDIKKANILPLHDEPTVPRPLPNISQGTNKTMEPKLNLTSVTANKPKIVSKEISKSVPSPQNLLKAVADPGISNDILAKGELPPGNKLVTRLNPNLAALLSRTTSPRLESNESISPSETSQSFGATSSSNPHNAEHSPNELTHATKARAKGPKRRAPKAQTTVSENASSDVKIKPMQHNTPPSKPSPVSCRSDVFPAKKSVEVKSSTDAAASPALKASSQPVKSNKLTSPTSLVPSASLENDIETVTKEKIRPTIAIKSPELRRVSSSLNRQLSGPTSTVSDDTDKVNVTSTESVTKPTSSTVTKSHEYGYNHKRAPAPNASHPLTPSKTRSSTVKEAATENLSADKPSGPSINVGLGLDLKPKPAKFISPKLNRHQTPPQTPPLMQSGPVQDPSDNHNHIEGAKINTILQKYFTTMPKGNEKLEFDTHSLLSATSSMEQKYKTISNNVWEITNGGKKNSMPAQQEHILYEDSLYLIVHTFDTPTSNKGTDVYLWCGDSVAEGAIEDAQLFCKKEAREHNVKLEIIKQGKEPAKLFQALGGIVITRRNKSSALYMLCGRRHLGHVAFDEVDFTVDKLCSGFTYLISSRYGRLLLWKGRGATADEVGCARLIGMDLGLTGEIEEVDEGSEPASFWDAFPQQSPRTPGTDRWMHRAEHQGYPCNLYHIGRDRPKSSGGFWGLRSASPPKASDKAAIEPIDPFSHRSLDTNNIYILDAYCSVYVLILAANASLTTEFVTALHLAQEIAMLSPSIQDRSLLPSCFVCFGDPPTDVKACFRKWNYLTFGSNEPASIKLEDVMQALNL